MNFLQKLPIERPVRWDSVMPRRRSHGRPVDPAVPAIAVAALAVAFVAVGALAIGSIAIGRIAAGRVRIKKLTVDDLTVRRLNGIEQVTPMD